MSIERTDALSTLKRHPGAFTTRPDHPGTIVREEFLEPLNLTPYRLAKATGMTQTRVGQILRGERSITADTAVRLALALDTTAEFWMGLQSDYDLRTQLAADGATLLGAVRSLRGSDSVDAGPEAMRELADASRRELRLAARTSGLTVRRRHRPPVTVSIRYPPVEV